MRRLFSLLLFFILLVSTLGLAVDFTPSGNINGRNIYTIYNFTNVTGQYFFGNGAGLTNISAAVNTSALSVNTTQLSTSGGILKIIETYLTGLFYTKSEVDVSVGNLQTNISNGISAASYDNSTQASLISTLISDNTTQASLIILKLDITDQRYNDTAFVISTGGLLQTNISTGISGASSDNATQASLISTLRSDNTTQATLIDSKANSASPTFTGTAVFDSANFTGILWINNVNSTNTTGFSQATEFIEKGVSLFSKYKNITASDQDNTTQANIINSKIVWTNRTVDPAKIDGAAYALMMTNPPNQELPHFIIQSGGPTQASVLLRSFMIQNEINNFSNTTAVTDCGSYMSVIGETLKIDCNTTTTGADLLVSDDLQVVGDMWLKDVSGEWHYMTRELEENDNTYKNIVFGNLQVTVNNNILRIANLDNKTIIVNLNGTVYDLGKTNDSISLNIGNNTNPQINYVSYQGTPPVLTIDTSHASARHADVWEGLVGNGTTYMYLNHLITNDEFVYNSNSRFDDEGSLYIDGFTVSATASSINYSSGTYWDALEEKSVANNLTSSNFVIVLNNGNFIQATSFTNITQYNDGGAIGSNKYYQAVVGILQSNDTTAKMVIVPSTTPGTEYSTSAAAEQDAFGTTTFTVNNANINGHFLPLSQVILKQGLNTLQAYSNGRYYKNIIGLPVAGTAASGTNDHALLTNLDYASSGHTGFASTIYSSSDNTTQASLIDLKANLASPTFTGTVIMPLLNVSGTLFVELINITQRITTDNATQASLITTLRADNTTQGVHISTLQADNTTQAALITTLRSDNTTQAALITNLGTDNTTQATLINNRLQLAGGSMTGNITFGAASTNRFGVVPFYIWYVNATWFDCVNASGTLYNRGNASWVCQ